MAFSGRCFSRACKGITCWPRLRVAWLHFTHRSALLSSLTGEHPLKGRKYLTCCVRLSPEKEPERFVRLVEHLAKSGALQRLGIVPLMCGSATGDSPALQTFVMRQESTNARYSCCKSSMISTGGDCTIEKIALICNVAADTADDVMQRYVHFMRLISLASQPRRSAL